MQHSDSAAAATAQVVALAPPTPGSWYRVIASYDAVGHTMSLYIGGKLQGTTKFAASWSPTGPLSFGSGLEKGTATDWYAGSLADMWVWNRSMTPAQVDKATQ
jgi:hypothetical protein